MTRNDDGPGNDDDGPENDDDGPGNDKDTANTDMKMRPTLIMTTRAMIGLLICILGDFFGVVKNEILTKIPLKTKYGPVNGARTRQKYFVSSLSSSETSIYKPQNFNTFPLNLKFLDRN